MPTFRFYASSLLILYDGAWALENGEGDQQNITIDSRLEPADEDEAMDSFSDEDEIIIGHHHSIKHHEADVRMIDFANCVSNADYLKNKDEPPTDDEEGSLMNDSIDISLSSATSDAPLPGKKSPSKRKAVRVSYPPTTKGPDSGYLLGLRTLIKAFEEIWLEHGGGGHVKKSDIAPKTPALIPPDSDILPMSSNNDE
jgi:hypothetical protein